MGACTRRIAPASPAAKGPRPWRGASQSHCLVHALPETTAIPDQPSRLAMPPRISGLTKLTLETTPTVCHECIWWQSRGRRTIEKHRGMEKVELEFGAFGTVYYDGDGHVLGSMQYGPAGAFPRAQELPAGPPGDDGEAV